jgi:hypothetical protein
MALVTRDKWPSSLSHFLGPIELSSLPTGIPTGRKRRRLAQNEDAIAQRGLYDCAADHGMRNQPRDRPRRGFACALATVSVGLGIIGLIAGLTLISAGASTIKSNQAYARAQLLKLSDMPHGYTRSGDTSVGTSDGNNSASLFTMTQFPDIATCLGEPPALSVVAAEATSADFLSKDGNTDVFDIADVYTSVDEAKTDFPPLTNPKFAKCFVQAQGSLIVSTDKSDWASGSALGTPVASVVSHQPKYGDQSGVVEVDVPVTLPEGQGTSNDFLVAVVIRVGRSVAELMIDQGDTTPSTALTNSLALKATERMKAKPPGNTIRDA